MSDLTLSLQRLAALLELYARERRPLSSAAVGSALAAPRSSVAALLKALVQMGWLAHDRREATYLPTARFAKLGEWVLRDALVSPALVEAVQELQVATGETVSLSAPADLDLEVLHVTGPDVGIRLVIQVGSKLALWGTAIGTAYLATIADPTIRSMYRRSEASGATPRISLASALAAVRRSRENGGIAFAESAVVPEVAAVSASLPDGLGWRRLVVSIGGPIPRMRARRAFIEDELAGWLERLPDRLKVANDAEVPAVAPAPARTRAAPLKTPRRRTSARA
jgi:DNA-binding IclR family transcriptional regulator